MDGTDVEILNWLDEHSRLLIACTAHPRVTGDIVVASFLSAVDEHGTPASTLTDRLSALPQAVSMIELQAQLDAFRHDYNESRPHRALGRATPGETYRATPKAIPNAQPANGPFRIRYDHVAADGKVSLRCAGRMHHLGIGITHARKRVLALIDETTVTVVHLDTGEILSEHTIDPDRTYWRNTQKEPGRWPGSFSNM